MKNSIHNKTFYIIFAIAVIVLPGIIGGILSAVFQNLIYLEVMYVVFGLVDLLLIVIRIRMRDGQNYKKNKTIYEDKTTDEFRTWRKEQYLIALIGAIDLSISLIVFAISLLL